MDPKQQRTRFFRHLWRGGQYSFYWVMPGRKSYWFEVGCFPEALKPIERNVYFGVHPTTCIPEMNAKGEPREPMYVRSQNQYIAAINCLYVDLDGDKSAAMYTARTFSPTPSVVIDSGGGAHCYWLLDHPLVLVDDETREYARGLQARWVGLIKGDNGSKDLSRVLRVPGSRNYKDKYAPDFPAVDFVSYFGIEYSLQELTARLPAIPRKAERQRVPRQDDGTEGERVLRIAEGMIERAPGGAKHTELIKAARLAGGAVGAGWVTQSEAEQVLEQAIRAKPDVESLSGALDAIEDGLRYGKDAPL